MRLHDRVRDDGETEDRQDDADHRLRVPGLLGHQGDVRTLTVFMIDVVKPAGDERQEKPRPEGILLLFEHDVQCLHLAVLDINIEESAGDNGKDKIEGDVSYMFGRRRERRGGRKGR